MQRKIVWYAIVVISLGVTLVSPTIMGSLGNETWDFHIFEPTVPYQVLTWFTLAVVFALLTVFGGWVARTIGKATSFLGTAVIGTFGFAAALVVSDYLFSGYGEFKVSIWFTPALMRDVLVMSGLIAVAAATAGLALGAKLFVPGSPGTPSLRAVTTGSPAEPTEEQRGENSIRLVTTET